LRYYILSFLWGRRKLNLVAFRADNAIEDPVPLNEIEWQRRRQEQPGSTSYTCHATLNCPYRHLRRRLRPRRAAPWRIRWQHCEWLRHRFVPQITRGLMLAAREGHAVVLLVNLLGRFQPWPCAAQARASKAKMVMPSKAKWGQQIPLRHRDTLPYDKVRAFLSKNDGLLPPACLPTG
jgi:hypothetical protein